MRRLLTLSALILPLLLTPNPASACEIEEVIFTGGCTDWTAELLVHFRIGMTEADVGYDVAIEDQDGNVVLSTSGTAIVTDYDGDRYGTLLLSGTWDEVAEGTIELYGMYTVRGTFTLYIPWLEYMFTYVYEEVVTLECAVVPNADVTWGEVKSQYR
ncbi:MAG: hypothetical protein ABR506_13085 [Candidatus Krumholzibacteriia bacterium]